jgi:hypothetical protein
VHDRKSEPSSCLLISKFHLSFCLSFFFFFFFFLLHARKTSPEQQPSPPSSRRKTSYLAMAYSGKGEFTSTSHHCRSTYTHTHADRLYKRAIEHCVPPARLHWVSPQALEGVIWQQLVEMDFAKQGFQLQFLPQLQQIRKTWTEKYGYTFGPGPLEPTPPPPPTERETERVDLLDRVLPTDLAAWTTLDDLTTVELRKAVEHVQSLMGRESVARCVQALWRYNGDPRGAIDWLGRISHR